MHRPPQYWHQCLSSEPHMHSLLALRQLGSGSTLPLTSVPGMPAVRDHFTEAKVCDNSEAKLTSIGMNVVWCIYKHRQCLYKLPSENAGQQTDVCSATELLARRLSCNNAVNSLFSSITQHCKCVCCLVETGAVAVAFSINYNGLTKHQSHLRKASIRRRICAQCVSMLH